MIGEQIDVYRPAETCARRCRRQEKVMSEIIRIESPEFENYHELSTWIDALVADPVPHPEFDIYTVNEILQVFAAHQENEDIYSATVFVLASPDKAESRQPAREGRISFAYDRRY